MTTALPLATEEEITARETDSDAPPARAEDRRSTVKKPSSAALRTERLFALGVAVVPFLGVLVAIVWHAMTVVDAAVLFVMYTITGLGITVGYHRLFTHRSFECPPWVRAAFAIAGSMAVQGPVLRWVADHRRHHAHSDKVGDPHSPHLGPNGEERQEGSLLAAARDLWYAHIGWFFATEKTRIKKYAPDLLVDRQISKIDRNYFTWLFLTFAIPFVLGALFTGTLRGALTALLWGGFVRLFLVHHVTWSINSICHVFGKRPYDTRDQSTNNFWLAIPSFGESWHNAHHAFPSSAVHGLGTFEIDTSAWLIQGLARVGLAWNVKRPTEAQLASRKRQQAA